MQNLNRESFINYNRGITTKGQEDSKNTIRLRESGRIELGRGTPSQGSGSEIIG